MVEAVSQFMMDVIAALVWSAASVLIAPTVLLLLLKKFAPAAGDPLWRGYCQLLAWLVIAPIRLVRLLVREAFGRRNR